MYEFAIVALLALAVIKFADFLVAAVPALDGFRRFLPFVLGIGAVFTLDYSLFSEYGIGVRNEDMGMILTGFMVAGLTTAWRVLFGWMGRDGSADETVPGRTMRAA